MLIRCWVSSTIMIPRTIEEKFLHYGSVERVLYHGSMDDCADSLFGIEHQNDSYVVVARRSSYTVEVRKGSYTMEGWTIVLIRCWGIKHHNRFLCHGSVEKLLHRGSVERVLYRGSIDDCADLLLGYRTP